MGGLFGGGASPPPIPPPAPLPNQQQIQQAQQNAVQLQMMRSGRMSTILTNPQDNTKLGD